jgi:hypothetical protein
MAEFIEQLMSTEWEVDTPTGWQSFSGIGKTIEYDEWVLVTENNKSIVCADKHILHDENWNEIYCEDLKIGKLADRISASNFSTECIVNKNSLGGHNFWINDIDWIDRIYKNNVIRVKPNYDLNYLEHRGGWKSIINNLNKNDFFNINSKFDFFDIIENKFLFHTNYKCENEWAAIVHCTPTTPSYLDNLNLNTMFKNNNFIESIHKCVYLITLNSYITNFMKKKIEELGINIPIYTLKHPVDTDNIILFDYNNYINNIDKKIIQIGQQLRRVTSIYLLKIENFSKLWLTGTTSFTYCNSLFETESKYLNIDKMNLDHNVKMYYTNTFEEYDELLSKNIVFIDLYDAAANNSVLECIIRNTPIIINKIEPIVEYLGDDYPLYFTDLEEVPKLLTDTKILEAHQYLSKMNKNNLDINYFVKSIMSINYKELVNKNILI